jgi:monovalent cation/hydrogen antiporter
MQAAGISHVELVILALLLLVAALAALAKRVGIPYPIVLVIGGLCLSLVPHAPRITLNPNVVFLIILPPLIFFAAFHTSWREFRHNLLSIFMLAFGLVGFTVFGVALAMRWLLPNFDWRLGLVLGAVVATTDPISATATARRLGIPRRLTDLLEAESLVNDGSGLVALKFTAALVITGVTPTFLEGVGQLFYLITAGTAIGLMVGVIFDWVERNISEAPIEITISIVTPYIAYLTAEAAGCSGVMATIACGLFLGRRSSGYYSLHARLESSAVWRTVDFALNGVVFLVLGLQLPVILSEIQAFSIFRLLIYAALFCAVVILLRLVWVFPSAWLISRLRARFGSGISEPFSKRAAFVVGWAGMRGVLALAAAISLPERLNNGEAFPYRNLLIFLTFSVIFATLVLQGLSLPPLIRKLGLSGSANVGKEEEIAARREMISAALASLEQMRQNNTAEQDAILDQIKLHYQSRLALLEEESNQPSDSPNGGSPTRQQVRQHDAIARQLREVERSVALRLRQENKVHDEVLRDLERELDLLDAHYSA